jgi:hypothetical protein
VNSASFIKRLIMAIWQRPSIKAAAPSPLPVLLTVIAISGCIALNASAKASPIGPTVVEPSTTMPLSAAHTAGAIASIPTTRAIIPTLDRASVLLMVHPFIH